MENTVGLRLVISAQRGARNLRVSHEGQTSNSIFIITFHLFHLNAKFKLAVDFFL